MRHFKYTVCMASGVDPDQTAPMGLHSSGLTRNMSYWLGKPHHSYTVSGFA